jgi:lysophospholipase L1-like esterase
MKYLALGDSYTIGESLDFQDNFPSQVCALFKQENVQVELSDLIAVTGWTTDELSMAIAEKKPAHDHDWVTLLIGVNNQYRKRDIQEYEWQFYALLCQAILFAGNRPQRVMVISIPDWGLTPFNQERNLSEVSNEIDAFNRVNKKRALEMGVHYIDITASTREHAQVKDFLAKDGLHYSRNEYAIWANTIKDCMTKQLKSEQ